MSKATDKMFGTNPNEFQNTLEEILENGKDFEHFLYEKWRFCSKIQISSVFLCFIALSDACVHDSSCLT